MKLLLLWLMICLPLRYYELFGNHPLAEKSRGKIAGGWNADTWYSKPVLVVAAIVGTLIVPLTAFVGMVLAALPQTRDGYTRWVRRTVLDREGLLKPQMPAPRCFVHDLAYDTVRVTCPKCKREFHVYTCKPCCNEQRQAGMPIDIEDGSWRCDDCFVPICPEHHVEMTTQKATCAECHETQTWSSCAQCETEHGADFGVKSRCCPDCYFKAWQAETLPARCPLHNAVVEKVSAACTRCGQQRQLGICLGCCTMNARAPGVMSLSPNAPFCKECCEEIRRTGPPIIAVRDDPGPTLP